MSTAVPYRLPSPDRVRPEPWLVTEAGGARPLSDAPPAWDYATDIDLARTIQIDFAGVVEDCALPPEVELNFVVRATSEASLLRRALLRVPITAGASRIELDALLPGREIAGAVVLETLLELAQDAGVSEPFSASFGGCILWRDEVRVALEGDSGLLPVSPAPFSELGLPAGAWYVSVDSARWDWPAMGSLLVMLNTENAAVAAAIEEPDSESAAALYSALEADVVADLVGRALDDEGFQDEWVGPGVPDDAESRLSLGAMVRSVIAANLVRPNEELDDAIARLTDLRRADPSLYRATVQAGVEFPRAAQ